MPDRILNCQIWMTENRRKILLEQQFSATKHHSDGVATPAIAQNNPLIRN